jgi:hypothetical protein
VLGGAYGVSGPNPLWAQGLLGLAGFLIFGMRYNYVALTDRRLIFLNASFWTSRPKGFAWADPRDSITISDLQTDNKLWKLGQGLQPDQTEPPYELPRVLAPRGQGDERPVGRPDHRSASGLRSGRRSGSGGPARPRPHRRHHPRRPPRCRTLRRRRRVERSARDPLLPWRGSGGVAQSGRALPSHGRGQGFESPHLHAENPQADSESLATRLPLRWLSMSPSAGTSATS